MIYSIVYPTRTFIDISDGRINYTRTDASYVK